VQEGEGSTLLASDGFLLAYGISSYLGVQRLKGKVLLFRITVQKGA